MERRPLTRPDPLPIPRRDFFRADWEHGTYRKWAEGYIIKNHWRVQHIFADKDDCMGEVAMVFAKCHRMYYGKVHTPQHFMALFKTAVQRMFTSHSRKDTKYRAVFDNDVEIVYDRPNSWQNDGMDEFYRANILHHTIIEPSEDAVGILAVAIEELPAEAKLAMQRLLGAPSELIDFLFRVRPTPAGVPPRDPGLRDQSLDKVIRRLFRIPFPAKGQPHDIVKLLRSLARLSN